MESPGFGRPHFRNCNVARRSRTQTKADALRSLALKPEFETDDTVRSAVYAHIADHIIFIQLEELLRLCIDARLCKMFISIAVSKGQAGDVASAVEQHEVNREVKG